MKVFTLQYTAPNFHTLHITRNRATLTTVAASPRKKATYRIHSMAGRKKGFGEI
jgi:hypothetical protein